ncbi:MAG: gliding motility-associated C-terminal domain-containing protein, partial [Saprospiraceae bacterium]|nr:gliding motility-associated C-terminal domain-containing protein [Saprospiraceae bacterium]
SGHAKICIPCTDLPNGILGHLTIFGPPDSLPWAPARSVWNQYAYNPLQINDDLTVPRFQKNQATYMNGKYNNFYQQESLLDSNGMYKVPAASLTGAIQCINYDPLTDEYLVIFDLYNRKDASAIADTNLAISFYDGDPTNGAALIGIYYSNKKIYRGDSLLNLEFRFSAKNIKDVFMVVNTVRNNSGNFNDDDFIQKECDYTDNISRKIDLPKIDTIHAAICKGNQFVFQDSIYTESGEYIQKLSGVKGCDSIYFRIFITATDSVFVNQKFTTCDAYVWNGKNISQSGIYQYDTLNHFGCDSITTLDLTIYKSTQSNSKQTACNRYIWNGTEYTQSGIYQYKSTNAVACDSIAILDLQIHFSDTVVQKISTCNPYSWNGRTLTQSGIYQFDTINQFICDSVVFLDLQITPLIQAKENHSACDQYFWNGKVYTNSGTYDYLTKNALGCDSMITLDLKINRSDSVFTAQTSCAAIDWNGKNYTQSGRYFHETKNVKGCDSVTTLDLTIIPPKENFINKDICDSITILGRKIDRAGRYDFRLADVNGCDSIIHYDIAIRSNQSSIKLSACDSLRWNVNGKVYTNSTLITEKFNNQFGCDSSITLDLHIAKSKQIFLEASACKEYFWPETQKILTQSGDYLHLLQTAEQCDSTIHLKLTIHPEYSDSDTIISNQKYTWPVNQITYDSSGNYFIKFISKDQCDSIHYLLLTIIKENNIFYPNVIHPNSQIKQNTAFTIFDNGAIKSIERLRIYDRWGELIWQRENFPSNDVNNGWDGTFRDKAVNPAVFVWVADLLLTDGRKITETGDVTVVE